MTDPRQLLVVGTYEELQGVIDYLDNLSPPVLCIWQEELDEGLSEVWADSYSDLLNP